MVSVAQVAYNLYGQDLDSQILIDMQHIINEALLSTQIPVVEVPIDFDKFISFPMPADEENTNMIPDKVNTLGRQYLEYIKYLYKSKGFSNVFHYMTDIHIAIFHIEL